DVMPYVSPPLRLISPKRSQLWETDPDRQQAYYSRRAWARLYTPGVLLGIYDIEELEGTATQRKVRPVLLDDQRDELHERLTQAARAEDEGKRAGYVAGVSLSDQNITPAAEAEQPAHAKKRPGRHPSSARREKRTGDAPKSGKRALKPKKSPREASKRAQTPTLKTAPPAASQQKLPINAAQYAVWVETWLPTVDTEEKIESRWRSE